MNLYLYCNQANFTDKQIEELKNNYAVFFVADNNLSPLFEDKQDKVIALDPDIVGWTFSNDTIDKIANLKAICLQTTGYEWIDYKYCVSKGIVVTNVPKYSSNAVAEQCIFMAFALTRKYPLFAKEGKMNWAPEFVAGDMTNKKAGIIGLGSIGTRVAALCKGLGMDVCYYSNEKDNKDFTYVEFSELISTCDYVFITVSKNEASVDLLSEKNLENLAPSANVISVVNALNIKDKLTSLVAEGKINGAAFEDESPDLTKRQGNIFVTPYNAYYTKEALVNMFNIWVDTIIAAASNAPINTIK